MDSSTASNCMHIAPHRGPPIPLAGLILLQATCFHALNMMNSQFPIPPCITKYIHMCAQYPDLMIVCYVCTAVRQSSSKVMCPLSPIAPFSVAPHPGLQAKAFLSLQGFSLAAPDGTRASVCRHWLWNSHLIVHPFPASFHNILCRFATAGHQGASIRIAYPVSTAATADVESSPKPDPCLSTLSSP